MKGAPVFDENGDYTLTSTQENFSIIAITDFSTVDSSSGVVLDGVILKAPQNSSMSKLRVWIR